MKIWIVVSTVIILFLSTSVNAALIGRLAATEGGTDYQAYYDDVANLTWLQDANASVGSAYDSGVFPNVAGRMTWANANAWAADLTVNDVGGWRLPDTMLNDPTCSGGSSTGTDCTGSEMGNLFFNVFGLHAGFPLSQADGQDNLNLFSNISINDYWSATQTESTSSRAYTFIVYEGYQGTSDISNTTSADYARGWAVHSGDVSAVPVPAAVWLFGSGLIGLIGFARRKAS